MLCFSEGPFYGKVSISFGLHKYNPDVLSNYEWSDFSKNGRLVGGIQCWRQTLIFVLFKNAGRLLMAKPAWSASFKWKINNSST
jgi:hypothetical protein